MVALAVAVNYTRQCRTFRINSPFTLHCLTRHLSSSSSTSPRHYLVRRRVVLVVLVLVRIALEDESGEVGKGQSACELRILLDSRGDRRHPTRNPTRKSIKSCIELDPLYSFAGCAPTNENSLATRITSVVTHPCTHPCAHCTRGAMRGATQPRTPERPSLQSFTRGRSTLSRASMHPSRSNSI